MATVKTTITIAILVVITGIPRYSASTNILIIIIIIIQLIY